MLRTGLIELEKHRQVTEETLKSLWNGKTLRNIDIREGSYLMEMSSITPQLKIDLYTNVASDSALAHHSFRMVVYFFTSSFLSCFLKHPLTWCLFDKSIPKFCSKWRFNSLSIAVWFSLSCSFITQPQLSHENEIVSIWVGYFLWHQPCQRKSKLMSSQPSLIQ